MRIMLAIFTWIMIVGADATKDKPYGLYSNETTNYLYDIESVPLIEVKYIYLGKLKTLRSTVPVTVLLYPLENTFQEMALRDLLNLSIDRIKEESLANNNILIIDNQFLLLNKLQSTIGAIGIVNNSILYNHDGKIVKIEVAEWR